MPASRRAHCLPRTGLARRTLIVRSLREPTPAMMGVHRAIFWESTTGLWLTYTRWRARLTSTAGCAHHRNLPCDFRLKDEHSFYIMFLCTTKYRRYAEHGGSTLRHPGSPLCAPPCRQQPRLAEMELEVNHQALQFSSSSIVIRFGFICFPRFIYITIYYIAMQENYARETIEFQLTSMA